jgi:FtsH-binding integral membrane protein
VAESNGGAVVVMAALMTLGKGLSMLGLVAVLTVYAYYTKTDFTTPWAVMLAFVTSIVIFFMFFFINWAPAMQTFYCSLGIFVFGLYLIIDTQMVMGNRSFAISMDDYVVAALLIYIDIIQLFLYILTLLGGRK